MSLRSIEFDWTKEPTTTSTGKTPPNDPMTRGERRAVLIIAAVLAALIVIGTAVWAVLDSRSDSANPADKCVTVGVASSMGGNVEHACGRAAHDWCVAADAQHDPHAQAVQAGCRNAGILP